MHTIKTYLLQRKYGGIQHDPFFQHTSRTGLHDTTSIQCNRKHQQLAPLSWHMLRDPFQTLVPHPRDLRRVARDMPGSGEDKEPRLHLSRLQSIVQLERLRNGHARVMLSVEQQRRCARASLGGKGRVSEYMQISYSRHLQYGTWRYAPKS